MVDYSHLNLIKVSNCVERLAHTSLALSMMVLVLTGLSFYSRNLAILAEFFGGIRQAITIHNYAGLVFLISVITIFVVLFKESFTFEKDDIKWILSAGGYLWKADVPEAGRFNPGQKGMYFFTVFMGIIMGATGWTMWQAPIANYHNPWISMSYPIHSLGAILFIAAWMVHAYFGSICNPGSLASMTYGWVSKAWVRKQHGKWYREHVLSGKA